MTAVLDITREDEKTPALSASADDKRGRTSARAQDNLRRCLVSGEMKPRAEMIRFVIAPDFSVVPDLSENLPGHGLWISAQKEAIAQAVKKNLFAKAAKQTAHPAADLADVSLFLLRKRCLDLLGMAKGAGAAVLGEAQTETALRTGKINLLLQAQDAARNLDNRFDAPVCALFSREEMGAALGYAQIVYAGLTSHGLTAKLKQELARLHSMVTLTVNSAMNAAQDASSAPVAVEIIGKNEG